MKPGALSALSRHNKVEFIGHRLLWHLGVLCCSILQFDLLQLGSASPVPFPPTFIDGSIRALRLASSAVDTLVRYNYRHFPIFEALKSAAKIQSKSQPTKQDC